MDISERIRLLISQKKLSKRAFGKAIGCTDTTINNIISGRNEPGYKTLFGIVQTYDDISAEWLLTGKGKMIIKSPVNLEADDQKTLLELCEYQRKEIKELKEELKEKNKQLGDSLKSNLLLLEREKTGGISQSGLDIECGSVG